MFFGALARHGPPGRYQLFHSGAEAFLRSLTPGANVRIDCAPLDALFRNFDGFPFRVWHDADADLPSAARLRTVFSRRAYPITATPHVLSYQGLLGGWIARMLLGDVLPCDAIVCISRSARDTIAKLLAQVGERLAARHPGADFRFPGRLALVPYSMDTERFRPRDRAEVRAAMALPQDAFVLLWIGRLSAVDKGDLVPLLRVFRNLVRRFPDRKLLLVIGGTGTPDYVETLRTAAADHGVTDHVQLLGRVDPSQRHLLHAAADVFVSPVDNMQETLGNTPQEALSCGVPQVVADWDGYRDMVVDGQTGFLIPTYWGEVDGGENPAAGLYDSCDELLDHYRLAQAVAVDTEAMERALAELIANDELRRRMGEASRRRALETYGEPVVMAQFDALWNELEEVAATLPFAPAPHPETPAFVHTFSNYATHLLAPTSRVAALERESWPAVDPRLRLDETLLAALLRASTPSSDLATLDGGDGERRRHVLWLLKHGLLRLEKL
jgi:glycosyltransferase involved in cell wall biosynthesis